MFRFIYNTLRLLWKRKNKQFDKKSSRYFCFSFSNRYLSTLKMMLAVQLALVTVLLFGCFCSAYEVTGTENPLAQRNFNNKEVSGTLRLRLLGNLADSRISLAQN